MQATIRLLGVTLGLLAASGCRRSPQPTLEVIAVFVQKIPLDAHDRAWSDAPEHMAALLPQDVVEPRLLQPSTPMVRVRALTDGNELAFRLEWQDPSRDDVAAPGRFPDACAVQLPALNSPEPPNPQMGEPGRPVQLTYWRADWQAWSEGRRDNIRELYPNASVDHYPFAAPSLAPGSTAQKELLRLYAPAEAAGNRRAGPRASPVEDLVAEGPGTLAPAPQSLSRGKGVFSQGAWRVVLARSLTRDLGPGSRSVVAFAVWQGGRQETGARKMRSGWIPLRLEARR
ncbi:MAG: ethylbenzene dehydrogenase-related protein [Bryobacteraceae bacterium]